jgi:hypothetical protein
VTDPEKNLRRAELYIIERLNMINMDLIIFSDKKSQNHLLLPQNASLLLYLWQRNRETKEI